jgi:hypothetical protein
MHTSFAPLLELPQPEIDTIRMTPTMAEQSVIVFSVRFGPEAIFHQIIHPADSYVKEARSTTE